MHGNLLDPGILAESLLFYQNVHVVFDHSSLMSLLTSIGPEMILELISDGLMTATFVRDATVTHTRTKSGLETHNYLFMEQKGHKEARFRNKEDQATLTFERALGKSWAVRRAARKFASLVPFERYAKGDFGPDPIDAAAKKDIQDNEFASAAVRAALSRLVPGLPINPEWYFKILDTDEGFIVDTNLDLTAINQQYHEHVPASHSTITPAYLLTCILDSRADIAVASHYLADIVTPAPYSDIMRIKFSSLIGNRIRNEQSIELFQDTTLNNAKAIRQAVNSKEKSFEEFVALLRKADKFKKWIKTGHPDATLLEEYYKVCYS